jgi:3'-phosphoadenosine 5'-phosphosulfate (PAPS) 3'-phosphatase
MHHIPTLLRTIGEFQLAEQQKVKATDVSEKSLNQLVSYVDIESEKMLVEGLLKITADEEIGTT